jgi:hypothetical protein
MAEEKKNNNKDNNKDNNTKNNNNTNNSTNNNHNKRNTLIMIVSIAAIAFGLYLMETYASSFGEYAEVAVDGVIKQEIPLTEDITINIDGYDGGVNRLGIKDGKCSITEADCPDKLCVKQGKIRKTGESIICLPHRVVVTIRGKKDADGDGVDAITR